MIKELRARGMRCRESGAFLLGTTDGNLGRVTRFVCYDDLDPCALDAGIVVFTGSGYSALWAQCKKLGVRVLGDVHTHGDEQPQQSETDRVNPMIPEHGHMALILPLFAGTWCWRFQGVAVYEYMGNYRWRNWSGRNRLQRVTFRLF